MGLFFWLFVCIGQLLFAETLALYLSWYDDPTTTMTIQWHTSPDESSDIVSLQYPTGNLRLMEGSHLELGPRLVHTVKLERLSPDTEYSFRVGEDPKVYKFQTAPKNLSHPLRFCIGGDLYHTPDLFRKMCRTVAEKDPLFAVLGGDIAYALNAHPFQFSSSVQNRWFSFLKEWEELMVTKEGRIIPFLLIPGNHDITKENAKLWFSLFAFEGKHLYRTVDFGSYLRLICLDTEHLDPIEGKQTEWLKKTLSKRSGFPYLFAVYHVAAYPSHYAFKGKLPEKIRTYWCPLFDQYPLTAIFEHHNHDFKKTFPLRNNRIDNQGTIYFGDGCWGALPRVPKKHKYLEKSEQKNHVYFIELDSTSAKIQAVDIQGEILDQTELPKTG